MDKLNTEFRKLQVMYDGKEVFSTYTDKVDFSQQKGAYYLADKRGVRDFIPHGEFSFKLSANRCILLPKWKAKSNKNKKRG